ncbi:hypothetical protein CKO12_14200, partial [Chromatium okenii]|uniref:Ig-like domain-containing protein n=1 Tax=Chromatium okenii TaxID=61644 RepID=UPI0019058BFF
PSADLDASTEYYVLIDSGAFKDAANNVYTGISSTTALSFTTAAADTTAPTLTSSTPVDNATAVVVGSDIVLTFNENVTAVTGKNLVIYKTSDNSVVATIAADDPQIAIAGGVVTVNPSADLDASTEYYVLIDSGAFKDAANNVYTGISSTTALSFTTAAADTTAPTLTSNVPADNATAVVVGSDIVLTFNENVTAVTGKNVVIHKTSDNSVVATIDAADPQIAIVGGVVTVNPTADLDPSTEYYVLIDNGAFEDAANNVYTGISSTTALSFTTAAADTTAPTLTSNVPADNATAVVVGSDIVLTFNENVTAVTGKNVVIHKTSDNSVVATIAADDPQIAIAGGVVTVNPTADLDASTEYYVLIDSGAFKDAANNVYTGISSTTALSFTTAAADTTAPTLTSSTPVDNATAVVVGSDIVLTFNENVTAVTGKNLVIYKTSDNSVVATIAADDPQIAIAGGVVTVNPSADLDASTEYYVLIDSGAFKDAANNVYTGISSTTALSFTTAAA